MEVLDIFFYLQSFNTVLAVIFNLFLIYLVGYHTRNNIGAYKWIIISFAAFEAIYSIVVLVGMPVHYVADGSWLVFNHGGLIGNTPLSFLGPSLYCTFYEIWIGFIVLHFIYRYVVVCKQDFVLKVQTFWHWKAIVVFAHFAFLTFTCFCGLFLCTRQVISESLDEKVRNEFHLDGNTHLGYILLRHKNTDGMISIFGTSTIANHYLLVGSSWIIIAYSSFKIWQTIKKMQKTHHQGREVRVQRQMFLSLVIQTLVPVLFCHVPSLVYLSFPFWEHSFSFGIWSLGFTWMTTVNKVVDPIIVIFCIREYRRATLAIFRGRRGDSRVTSSSQVVTQFPTTTQRTLTLNTINTTAH